MHGAVPHPAWILPFVALLGAIAVMPLANPHWWEKRYPWVAVPLGLLVAGYYLFGLHSAGPVLHSLREYFSFICLIGSLFVVAGGIHISVKGEATPLVNTLFLLIGAVLANLIGTTGASMVLIRPWIRMNKYRITAFHIVFFIFIVSNCGGALTPIGDPPLFLGFLRGIPFFWITEHMLGIWAFVNVGLLAYFYVLDARNFRRAPEPVRQAETAHETWRLVRGKRNLLFLAAILGSVFITQPIFLREAVMLAAALAAYRATAKDIHQRNSFSFQPIREVAILFFGIFLTMVPALQWLELHAKDLGLSAPLHYYFGTGSLSALLDNAPTYLTFLTVALGVFTEGHDIGALMSGHAHIIAAISAGAVFFGAATYIGNGPNFLVKSIAEHAKVRTPSFFGYIARFTLPFLLPVLALAGFLFLR